MDKVIDVDFPVTWQSPVFVRIGNGTRERIDAPDAALAALLHLWPASSQSEYAVAKHRCADAIAQGSPDLARLAFGEAAVSARVL
ncbi:hypothetical protein FHT78_005075 [Rhizobium sp. BK196]|uniref:DUF982 domain-containing protein n=1 Tax=Rhizobium sp. BK196 TaxID=2587073 RepID=UPI00160ED477|nr:DUF982 domain-containing protein [Rhizobium sp. BK196]MBB3313283.1 hypothetical protein [Rhizobium sp. BK196]